PPRRRHLTSCTHGATRGSRRTRLPPPGISCRITRRPPRGRSRSSCSSNGSRRVEFNRNCERKLSRWRGLREGRRQRLRITLSFASCDDGAVRRCPALSRGVLHGG